MNPIRDRLTYANVVSTLALLLAMGAGSAWAAGELAPKSVGARQLRPGAVTAAKLRKNAVTAPKIKAASIKVGKLAAGSVSTAKLADGAVTAEKLAAGSVVGEKLALGSVTGDKVDESTLGTVPSAARTDFALDAESADPRAFAKVDQEGVVDTALSKGIAPSDVKLGKFNGIYCVSAHDFSPRGAQVTPRYNGSGTVTAYVTIGGTESCPAPQVEVQTFNGGSLIKVPFYIVLYR